MLKASIRKGIIKGNLNFTKVPKRTKFLRTESPWLMDQTVDELPPKETALAFRQESKRTYTKYFNPMTFDPRTPDYYETVRSEWAENVTREDFGSRKIHFLKF